jgi:hypothetical protein
MQQLASLKNRNDFPDKTRKTLSKYRDKFFICETVVVEQVKVLYILTYLFSSDIGEMHQPYVFIVCFALQSFVLFWVYCYRVIVIERLCTFLSTNTMQCIEQSLTYSSCMGGTYQLTSEQVKHDSQMFTVTVFFIVRNKPCFSANSLSSSRVIQDIFWQRSCDWQSFCFRSIHASQHDVSP